MKKARLFILILVSGHLAACLTQKKDEIQPVLSQSDEQLAAGDFQKSIDTYEAASEKYPGDPTVQNGYLRSIEAIRQKAEKAFEAKDYAEAARIYSILERNFPRFKSFETSISFTLPSLSRRIRDCRFNLCQAQARKFFRDGDFEKTVDTAKSCAQEYPDDRDFSASFKKIADDIWGLADKALAREDFVTAGKAYQSLSKSYASLAKTKPPASYSQSSLEEGLKMCRRELTRRGLQKYRQGKLAEAISTWEGLLSFDAENVEIKKAVETAREQLKKLKKD